MPVAASAVGLAHCCLTVVRIATSWLESQVLFSGTSTADKQSVAWLPAGTADVAGKRATESRRALTVPACSGCQARSNPDNHAPEADDREACRCVCPLSSRGEP